MKLKREEDFGLDINTEAKYQEDVKDMFVKDAIDLSAMNKNQIAKQMDNGMIVHLLTTPEKEVLAVTPELYEVRRHFVEIYMKDLSFQEEVTKTYQQMQVQQPAMA